MTRRCGCPRTDARDCIDFRSGRDLRRLLDAETLEDSMSDFDDPCECPCHDPDEDDEPVTVCRRCSECTGADHHWMDNSECMGPEDPMYCCKHCDAFGDECKHCDGEGGKTSPDGHPLAFCTACKGWGVDLWPGERRADKGGRVSPLPQGDGLASPVKALERPQMVAALYVEKGGCYYGLPDVDPWDIERDARKYAGPWPVVAHPPCERWGRYWSGGPSARVRRTKGDDGGCFAAALSAVRTYGGVLEHPEASHAFRAHQLLTPKWGAGWTPAGDWCGWVCCVAQRNYGHRARKLTWLYAANVKLPQLDWSIPQPSIARLDEGFHSKEERARAIKTGVCQRLSAGQQRATPSAFRDLLLSIARSASPVDTGRAATTNDKP